MFAIWANCCCSAAQSCAHLCDPMDCRTSGFPALHYFLEFAQTHVHWVGDAIQPSHPLSPPSTTFNLSQHQGLFSSLHQVAKVLEFQLQHQSFQWILEIIRVFFSVFLSCWSNEISSSSFLPPSPHSLPSYFLLSFLFLKKHQFLSKQIYTITSGNYTESLIT